MPFDSKEFIKTKFEPRQERVPVPDLKDFFSEDDEPVWIVKGLTGHELGRSNEVAERNKNLQAVVEGLFSAATKEKAQAVREMIGIDKNTPDDIAKRFEMLVLGSVDPVCDEELAIKICTCFPIEFYQITNRITHLTGQGHTPGKAPPSGLVQTPETV
jgi:hypothetical protein